jgi:hypothetical protein
VKCVFQLYHDGKKIHFNEMVMMMIIGISVDYGNILMSDEGKIQSRVDRGFESRSGQTKNHTIGI